MTPDPSRLGLIVTRSEALDAGLTRDQIRQRVRSGRWRRLDTGGWTGIREGVRYRAATLPESDVAGVGIRVTSVARAVVEVLEVLRRMGTVRGCRRAAGALAHLDGRRETVLESLSWARFLDWGLPLPDLPHEFWDDDGLVGRVDFWWPRFRLVGEADGRLTYATGDDLYAEKRREDRLRSLGLGVLRWGWSDLWDAAAEQLRRRLVTSLR